MQKIQRTIVVLIKKKSFDCMADCFTLKIQQSFRDLKLKYGHIQLLY